MCVPLSSLVSNQLAGSIPANIFEFAELSQLYVDIFICQSQLM
jgi:hypothetical protein